MVMVLLMMMMESLIKMTPWLKKKEKMSRYCTLYCDKNLPCKIFTRHNYEYENEMMMVRSQLLYQF